jgi:hypothetical protein
VDDAIQALALLAQERVMTLVPVKGYRSLVTEVAGGPVKGSWWGHPRGRVIFAIGTALEASRDVLACKLVEGKVTFVHRTLWPALLRVVNDPAWHEDAAGDLSRGAAKLLAEVEKCGRLELPGKADAAKRKELEVRHLVVSSSEHTAEGKHAAVLQSWQRWAASAKVAAPRMTLAKARATLAEVGIALAVDR